MKPYCQDLNDLEAARKNRERIEQDHLAEKEEKEAQSKPKVLTEAPITVAEHYPKVIEKIPIIKKSFDNGVSVRKISRDNKVAINTVRKVLRKPPFSLYEEVAKEAEKVGARWIYNKDYEPIEGLIEYFPDNFIPVMREWAVHCSTESRGKANLAGQAHALTLIANFIERIYEEARTKQDIFEEP